jgi:MFS family permease
MIGRKNAKRATPSAASRGQGIPQSPFALPNVRLFVLFRVFFNARFYYPVFTILFIDFGLTLSQFAILNAVWAATIVLMEVPSGALADVIGRRRLVVAAGMMMVVEIALLCFAPRGNPDLLFICFLVNRIISGTAEAAASGADEAIAYDTLKAVGLEESWGRVLETQVRFQSIGFIVAMLVGAAVYDPVMVQAVLEAVGVHFPVTRATTLRLPLYLTLAMSLATLLIVVQIREKKPLPSGECQDDGTGSGAAALCAPTIIQAFRVTLSAGRWIIDTPFVLVVILSGLLIDGTIRMVITLSSQYYRVIHIPEAVFGMIGAGISLLGLVIPRLARRMSFTLSPAANLMVMGLATTAGLVAMTLFLPFYGLAPAVLLYAVMYLKGFFVSDYLNRATDSARRATVLSFRGLAFNLSYGLLGVGYAALLAFYRRNGISGEDAVFTASFVWFPILFVLFFLLLLGFAATRAGAPFSDQQPEEPPS